MILARTTTPCGRRSICFAPHADGSHIGRAPMLRIAASASVSATSELVVALILCGIDAD